jgi:hypothetical protein
MTPFAWSLVVIAVAGVIAWGGVGLLLLRHAARGVVPSARTIAVAQRVERRALWVVRAIYLADLVVIVGGIAMQHPRWVDVVQVSAVPLFVAFFVRMVSGVVGRAGKLVAQGD